MAAVGSVRARDLYTNEVGAEDDVSGRKGGTPLSVTIDYDWERRRKRSRGSLLPPTSRARAARSNAPLTLRATRSLRSLIRLSISEGRTERLCAVCSDDESKGWSYERKRQVAYGQSLHPDQVRPAVAEHR